VLQVVVLLEVEVQVEHARREVLARHLVDHLGRDGCAAVRGRVLATSNTSKEAGRKVVNDGAKALVLVQAREVLGRDLGISQFTTLGC